MQIIDKDKVAIIVPVYNIEKYISRCVESLIKQTYQEIEILLINDGSEDRSSEIIEDYAKKDLRISVVNKNNGGLSSARNTGLDYASSDTKWIMFVDGDDWLDDMCIERCLDYNGSNNNYDLIFFPYIKEYDYYHVPVKIFRNMMEFSPEEFQQRVFMRLIGPIGKECNEPQKINNLSTAWGKLYSKRAIKNFRFEEIKYSEDTYFNMQVFNNVKKALYINTTFYHYYKENSQAITRNFNEDMVEWKEKLYSLMHRYLVQSELWTDCEQYLVNRQVIEAFGLCLAICNGKESKKEKSKRLQYFLQKKYFQDALKMFDYSSLLLPWKLFFYACKIQKAAIVFSYLNIMKIVKGMCKRRV